MMPSIHAGLSLNLDGNLLSAALPLLQKSEVDAFEWSFDALYHRAATPLPEWFEALLDTFSKEHRLIGHGIVFSLFSGKWLPEQNLWLQQLSRIARRYNFAHVTEHFGFMTGEDFHKGAPLGVPLTAVTLRLGQDRLCRLQDVCACAVGLENLAFAYHIDEVKKHGDFLQQLVQPVNGFIILDLHNAYCQSVNFNIPFAELLSLYPLHLVREIHLSGGSWAQAAHKTVRRDTHDAAVPAAVWDLLQMALPLCENVQWVILEQIGISLNTSEAQQLFQNDFVRMSQCVAQYCTLQNAAASPVKNFAPPLLSQIPAEIPEDDDLYQQQMQLSYILETAPDVEQARVLLSNSVLAHSEWAVEKWDNAMLATAMQIAQKWKDGFERFF